MSIDDILRLRIYNQQLAQPHFTAPGEVVRWLGAVQAQDYFGSLWAIGQRMKKCVEEDIEKSVADKTIVRTWPMRGTLHYVSPENARWMLRLLTPRVISRTASIYKTSALDAATFKKSGKIMERALRDGKQLTRDEVYDALAKGNVSPEGLRGLHIIGHLAQQGLICQGTRRGKQPTFTLLDEWLPPAETLQRDDAIARLTLNYFTGHGPATLQDFVWWSGLTVADARRGIDMVKSDLVSEMVDDSMYWFSPHTQAGKKMPGSAFLLPAYDEYTVAYKDRSGLVIDTPKANSMKGRMNVIFNSAIMIRGKVVGMWRRTLSKDRANVDIDPLVPLTKSDRIAVEATAKKYGKFLGMPVVFSKEKTGTRPSGK